jgi:transposase
MNKLAKRFVVALTPEQYTSKTCCKCLQPCGPWAELEEKMNRKIRGVRVCQNEECRLPQNRDRTGAANIGLQFCRLYEGKSPIRTMTDEDLEFHRLNTALCVACD